MSQAPGPPQRRMRLKIFQNRPVTVVNYWRAVVNMSRKYRNEMDLLERQVEDINIEKELKESKGRVVSLRSLAVKYKKEVSNPHRIVDTENGPPSDEFSDSASNKDDECKHEKKENVDHEGFKKRFAKIWTGTPGEDMQFIEMARLRQQLKKEEDKLKKQTENAKKELEEVLNKACSLRSLADKYKKELEENYSELDKVIDQKEILEKENVELKRRLAKLGFL
ncbi:hypothetical protein PRIPAC_85368 [Pristionchus pacificus]|uniref:Uncharacterized protein n=1 Tax=Pristionchus pacificus TaxID=54126 RepID=A0A2A6BGU9_PRIPA|nr:hypothetical protein PRIPAC_85368 [Pristionchus pacificus]|eukprot:PDM65073.1 hypothetical protein PRIPAC_53322 [Pristionchus pacificus]